MSKTRSVATDAWDAGARVAIFGAVDADRWVTLEPLVRQAVACGYLVIVADQGLDPLADRLGALAASLDKSLRRWPASHQGHRRRRWWSAGASATTLWPVDDLLWIDLPTSGLDVAAFVDMVRGWLGSHPESRMLVLAHDLAWRDDAHELGWLWDTAARSHGRLRAIVTAPGLPSDPWARAALLEASLVGVHRVDSHDDAVALAGYLNRSLQDGVQEHMMADNYQTNLLPISAFYLTTAERHLPLVLVDATGRPDFTDLFRVSELEREQPSVRVGWLVSPTSGADRSIQMTCHVDRPVTTAYTLWFRAPEHTALMRRIATAGRFLLGVQPEEEVPDLEAWVVDSPLPGIVRAALDRW